MGMCKETFWGRKFWLSRVFIWHELKQKKVTLLSETAPIHINMPLNVVVLIFHQKLSIGFLGVTFGLGDFWSSLQALGIFCGVG